ncbi:MAG: hypothetical protein J6A59_14235 [Lachnospiraceae bacterium]|nr:hypothetical protein [Lachnospiraceae bacterium]
MSEKSNKIKSQIIEKTTEIMSEYGRYIGSGIVVLTLFVICGTTLATRLANSKMPSGVMMTLPTVSEGKEAFSGDVFYVDGISYDEMVNKEYEADGVENIEKTENDIQEILAARQAERQKKAAEEILRADPIKPEDIAIYDPDFQGTPSGNSSGSTVTAGAPAQYTYADENGTYTSLGIFELTAYCPCPICCGIYSNMTNPTTASGTRATQGRTIATDTSVIPFGTQVVINGKIYTAEDTGGAIKGNRIDIYFESHTEALYFGRQKAEVFIVK